MTYMMWHDNAEKKPMSTKILEAAKYYAGKYGAVPNAAIVNPSDFRDINVEGIRVVAKLTVQRNYVLIGVE